jgi:hypothetical protein
MGGWGLGGDDGTGNAAAASQSVVSEGPSADVSAGARSRHFDNDDNVVPVIPDLEEEAEDDITAQVAAPPTQNVAIAGNVRSVRELDAEQWQRAPQLPTNPEEGVDLAVLMRCLCSERQVFEADTTWDYDQLFQAVASDINADLHAEEGNEDGKEENDRLLGPQGSQ